MISFASSMLLVTGYYAHNGASSLLLKQDLFKQGKLLIIRAHLPIPIVIESVLRQVSSNSSSSCVDPFL